MVQMPMPDVHEWVVRPARRRDAPAIWQIARRLAVGDAGRGFLLHVPTMREYEAYVEAAEVTVAEANGRVGAFLVVYGREQYDRLLPGDAEGWVPVADADRDRHGIPDAVPLGPAPRPLERLFEEPLTYIAQVGKDPVWGAAPLGRLLYEDLGRRVVGRGQARIYGSVDVAPKCNRKSLEYHSRQYGARFFAVRRDAIAGKEWVSVLGAMPLEAFRRGAAR